MPAFCTHDSCDWLVSFFFWRSCDDVPRKLKSLYCKVCPEHEYPTDSERFKGRLKRIHYKDKLNVQSIRVILPGGACDETGDGGGASGGCVGFFCKNFFDLFAFIVDPHQ